MPNVELKPTYIRIYLVPKPIAKMDLEGTNEHVKALIYKELELMPQETQPSNLVAYETNLPQPIGFALECNK